LLNYKTATVNPNVKGSQEWMPLLLENLGVKVKAVGGWVRLNTIASGGSGYNKTQL
jgi:hypothetical protein